MTIQQSFENKFIIEPFGCWNWIAFKNKQGYGQFKINKKTYRAHRVSMYLYEKFDLNDIRLILHKCNNTSCVNPEHLYIGSYSSNQRDIIRAGNHNKVNTTHCPQGHSYDDFGLKNNKGRRYCRICHRESQARYKERKYVQ